MNDEYYNRLLNITKKNDWQGWVEFFLKAIIAQSEINTAKAKEIKELYEKLKLQFIEVTHSQFAIPVLDAFFIRPVIDSTSVLLLAKIPNRITGNALLKKLAEENLITVVKKGEGRNPSVYTLPELINIVEERQIL